MSYIRQQQFKKPKALCEQKCLGDAFFFLSKEKGNCFEYGWVAQVWSVCVS